MKLETNIRNVSGNC